MTQSQKEIVAVRPYPQVIVQNLQGFEILF